jgi:hypothetical protein
LTLHSRCHLNRPKPAEKLVFPIARNGGARRDRTDDLMLAKHALYQLSYGPSLQGSELCREPSFEPLLYPRKVVGPGRLELPTSRLSGVRSNQLSYGPLAARRPTLSKLREPSHLGLAIASLFLAGSPYVSRGMRRLERETKTAEFRTFRFLDDRIDRSLDDHP